MVQNWAVTASLLSTGYTVGEKGEEVWETSPKIYLCLSTTKRLQFQFTLTAQNKSSCIQVTCFTDVTMVWNYDHWSQATCSLLLHIIWPVTRLLPELGTTVVVYLTRGYMHANKTHKPATASPWQLLWLYTYTVATFTCDHDWHIPMVTVVTLRPSITASSSKDRFTENISAVTSFTPSGCIVMSTHTRSMPLLNVRSVGGKVT